MKSDLDPQEMQKLSVFVSSLQTPLEQTMNAAKLIASVWVKGKAMGKYLNDMCNFVQIATMLQKTMMAYMDQFLPQVNGTEHMDSYLHALSVYRLMVAQIKKDTFNPITKKELLLEKKVLVDNTSQRPRMAPALDYGDMGTRFGRPPPPQPRPPPPGGWRGNFGGVPPRLRPDDNDDKITSMKK